MCTELKYLQPPIPSLVQQCSSEKKFIKALGKRKNIGMLKFNKPIPAAQSYGMQLFLGDHEGSFMNSFTFDYSGFHEHSLLSCLRSLY